MITAFKDNRIQNILNRIDALPKIDHTFFDTLNAKCDYLKSDSRRLPQTLALLKLENKSLLTKRTTGPLIPSNNLTKQKDARNFNRNLSDPSIKINKDELIFKWMLKKG